MRIAPSSHTVIGCLTALLVSWGCSPRTVTPASIGSRDPGSTVLLLPPRVTVTAGGANAVDERASQVACENVESALRTPWRPAVSSPWLSSRSR